MMLIIDMAKIELIGGQFEFFAYYRDGQNRITGGHIGFIVFI